MLATQTVFERDRQDRPVFRTVNDVNVHHSTIGYIGSPMVLHGRYHPDQAWLPFMQGTVLSKTNENFYDADMPVRRSVSQMFAVRRMVEESARVPHDCTRMYNFSDPTQHILPFFEYKYLRSVPNDNETFLWERKSPPPAPKGVRRVGRQKANLGPIHSVYIHRGDEMTEDDVIAWALESLRGRFIYSGGSMGFQYASDAFIAFMRFAREKPGRD